MPSKSSCQQFKINIDYLACIELEIRLTEIMQNNNDNNKLKNMSLGDHLEELRVRLILIVLGIIVGLIITLFFGKRLISFLEVPYYHAMQKFCIENPDEELFIDVPFSEKNLVNIRISGQNAESLRSLKPGDNFLAYVEFYQDDPNNPAFAELKKSSSDGIRISKSDEQVDSVKRLQAIELSEGFLVYLKVCLVFGFILVCPWVFWHVWVFISAGLYRHEKKFVHVAAPISALLFITGSVFFMSVVAPLAMSFFIRFNQALRIESNWTIQSYMSFVLTLTLVFGAAFQMPIGIVFAEMMGLISIETLAKNRKYVVLGLLFIAAVATPPDVISQVLLAMPLYILYESSIVVCRVLRKRKE